MKQYIGELISGAGMAILTWFLARRKRRNDFVNDLQSSINMLASENAKILDELINVKKQNVQLLYEMESLRIENSKLNKKLIELNKKLNNK